MGKVIGNRHSLINRNWSQIDPQAKIHDKSSFSALNWLRNAITWRHSHLIPELVLPPGLFRWVFEPLKMKGQLIGDAFCSTVAKVNQAGNCFFFIFFLFLFLCMCFGCVNLLDQKIANLYVSWCSCVVGFKDMLTCT